jgi:putative addiction module killer protein
MRRKLTTDQDIDSIFINHNQNIIVLLCGGDKSTQQNDIKQAKLISKEINNDLKGKI